MRAREVRKRPEVDKLKQAVLYSANVKAPSSTCGASWSSSFCCPISWIGDNTVHGPDCGFGRSEHASGRFSSRLVLSKYPPAKPGAYMGRVKGQELSANSFFLALPCQRRGSSELRAFVCIQSRSRCGRLASSSAMVGTTAMLQWPRSPRNHPRKPRRSIAVSIRSVFARRCSRDIATLVA